MIEKNSEIPVHDGMLEAGGLYAWKEDQVDEENPDFIWSGVMKTVESGFTGIMRKTSKTTNEIWEGQFLRSDPHGYVRHFNAKGESDNANYRVGGQHGICLLYTSPSPRDRQKSRMPSSA